MRKNIHSDTFSYKDIECIIKTDAGNLTEYNGIGWVIIDFETNIELAEGRAILPKNYTTTTSELLAIVIALQEVKKMDIDNIIIHTDFDGFMNKINKGNITENIELDLLSDILDTFNCWSIKKVNRDDLKRPHNLVSSIKSNENKCIMIDNLI